MGGMDFDYEPPTATSGEVEAVEALSATINVDREGHVQYPGDSERDVLNKSRLGYV